MRRSYRKIENEETVLKPAIAARKSKARYEADFRFDSTTLAHRISSVVPNYMMEWGNLGNRHHCERVAKPTVHASGRI
jgi:hypothetical protein